MRDGARLRINSLEHSEHDQAPWYAEPCAAGIVVTYSSGTGGERQIVTTDLHHGCTEQHSGTSAAAPLAAGILALVLQAKSAECMPTRVADLRSPKLTWRDMQHLLIRTAVPFNLADPEWSKTAAGYMVHHKFYFGKMDVERMVDAALVWEPVGPQIKLLLPTLSPLVQLHQAASLPTAKYTLTTEAATIDKLEHVQLTVSLDTSYRGRLVFTLLCPSGTRSVLLTERPSDRYSGGMDWTFMTTRCWDERCADVLKQQCISYFLPVRLASGCCSSTSCMTARARSSRGS